jgi:rhamnogalacturonan acetylesterase
VNKAVSGGSARSFTDEGHFQDLIKTVEKGDFVILQFGRNDRWLGPNDNGIQDAPGLDYLVNVTAIQRPMYVCLSHPFQH